MSMDCFLFLLKDNFDLDEVWQGLTDYGCALLYSEEEGAKICIYGHLPKNVEAAEILKAFPPLESVTETSLGEIDWVSQWEEHAKGYHEGFLIIDLDPYEGGSGKLRLQPGPGFGDLSHPTTRLVLELMSSKVKGEVVLDVGCGSGVLSLVACALGAKQVVGMDIDKEALKHAQENSLLNDMNESISFVEAKNCGQYVPKDKSVVVLMNMIQSEQAVAWESLGGLKRQVHLAITSGVLLEEEQSYLDRCAKWGWQLIAKKEEDGWLGFVFAC